MKFILPITLLSSTFLTTFVNARWQPGLGLTWDYLLGAKSDVILASKANVVTIDLEDADNFTQTLHSRDQKVVCYFPGGTIQKSRKADLEKFIKAGVGIDAYSDSGNQYVDIRNLNKLKPLMRDRMIRARKYGCDAVEVDNLGLYNHNVLDYTKEDSFEFAKMLAETAHEEDIAIGLKNVAGIAQSLQPYFDFAVVESCAESAGVCDYYIDFTKNKKAVFIVHYGDRGFKLSGSSLEKLVKEQGGHNFTCVLSERYELNTNSINYNCNNGNIINGSGKKSEITTTIKKTTTTTIIKTTTTTEKKTTTTSNPATTSKISEPSNTNNNPSSQAGANGTTGVTGATSINGATGAIGANGANGATGANSATGATGINGANGATGATGINGATGVNTAQGIQGAQTAQTAQGAQTAQTANNNPSVANVSGGNQSIPKNDNEDNENEGGNGVGTAVAVAAAGGLATAAIAGFIFLKKNKKYSSDNYDGDNYANYYTNNYADNYVNNYADNYTNNNANNYNYQY